MRTKILGSLLTAALLGSAGVAQAQSEFAASLNGAQEVPPVVTGAFGSATFDLAVPGAVLGINYSLIANNLRGAFMAHIHCGARGTNGPVVVWLAGRAGAPAGVSDAYNVNGPWIDNAQFTEANIIPNTGCGDSLLDLVAAMAAGRTYVNIHTTANGGGEIRGQISAVAGFSVP